MLLCLDIIFIVNTNFVKVNELIKLLEEERKNSAQVYQMLEKETKDKNDLLTVNSGIQ